MIPIFKGMFSTLGSIEEIKVLSHALKRVADRQIRAITNVLVNQFGFIYYRKVYYKTHFRSETHCREAQGNKE